jgi:hypothetical protein
MKLEKIIATIGCSVAVMAGTAYGHDYTSQVSQYGLIEGVFDGVLAPINLVVSGFKSYSFSQDGTGITSGIGNFTYDLGFMLGLSLMPSIAISSKKKSN